MRKLGRTLLATGMGLLLAVGLCRAAVVNLAIEQVVKGGLAATYTSSGLLATDTYKIRNDGHIFLHFKKTGAGACTVTITTPNQVQGLDISDQTVTIPATTGDKFVGPFPPSLFNDASSDVTFTISDTVGLSWAILRL